MSDDTIDEVQPIVLDSGSGEIKAGFAGDDAPRTVFSTIIGHRRHASTLPTTSQTDLYIGNHALTNKEILTIRYPIEHGIVTNWYDMEKIWHHTFSDLWIAPEKQPLLLTEASLTPIANREKAIQILFENFQVPGNKLSLSYTILSVFCFFAFSYVYSKSVCSFVLLYGSNNRCYR
jgi:actin-related protein